MPSLLLFDIDGTLVNVAGAGMSALRIAFREVFGVDPQPSRASTVKFSGRTDLEIFEKLAIAFEVPLDRYRSEFESLEQQYVLALQNEMSRGDPSWSVLPGVRELLTRLDSRPDCWLGLITGNAERGARIKLEPFDLNPFFPTGGFGTDDRDRGAVARIAARRSAEAATVEFATERIVVIGDTEMDIACARANGFRSVAVATGWASRESLIQARPDVLLDDLSDIEAVMAALGLPDRLP